MIFRDMFMENELDFLKPGMMLHVEAITPAGVRAKMKLPLIGMQQGDFILLQYPDPARWGDKYDVLREGYDIVIRALLEDSLGSVMAFKTTILPVANRPVRMLVIQWPQQVQQLPLRAETRHRTRLPAKVKYGDSILVAQLTDISVNGCCISLTQDDDAARVEGNNLAGKKLAILVENTNHKQMIKLLGVVKNQKEALGNWNLGLRLDKAAKANVVKLFDQMMLSAEE